jgi:hypothetical protein
MNRKQAVILMLEACAVVLRHCIMGPAFLAELETRDNPHVIMPRRMESRPNNQR